MIVREVKLPAKLVLVEVQPNQKVGSNWILLNHKYFTPIWISETEKIKKGDWFYVKTPNIHGGNIIVQSIGNGKDAWENNILTKDTDYTGYDKSHCVKILALPEHFSREQLQMIVSGELKEGDVRLIECEQYWDNNTEPRCLQTFKIKLNDSNHITIHEGNAKAEDKILIRALRQYICNDDLLLSYEAMKNARQNARPCDVTFTNSQNEEEDVTIVYVYDFQTNEEILELIDCEVASLTEFIKSLKCN